MTENVKWIKLSIGFFNDEKIRLIRSMPDADFVINVWILLLTLAGKTNDSGLIYMERNVPYSPEMIATLLGKTSDQARYALQIILNFKMIEMRDDGLISVTNWEKHQNTESLNKVKEQNKIRAQKFRERNRIAIQQFANSDVTHTSRDSNVTVTQQKEERREKIEERRKENKKEEDTEKRSRFSPPSRDEIISFFKETHNLIEPDLSFITDRFILFYESKGWYIGKSKMANWKASATKSLSWEDRRKSSSSLDKSSKYEKAITNVRECSGTTSTNF